MRTLQYGVPYSLRLARNLLDSGVRHGPFTRCPRLTIPSRDMQWFLLLRARSRTVSITISSLVATDLRGRQAAGYVREE